MRAIGNIKEVLKQVIHGLITMRQANDMQQKVVDALKAKDELTAADCARRREEILKSSLTVSDLETLILKLDLYEKKGE